MRQDPMAALLVLRILRERDCNDARDKIYGSLGMCNLSQYLVVDYHKTVGDVCQEAAIQLLRLSKFLYLLHDAWVSRDEQPPQFLPSWVPDWRCARRNSSWWRSEPIYGCSLVPSAVPVAIKDRLLACSVLVWIQSGALLHLTWKLR
jgi:hypothetical protein